MCDKHIYMAMEMPDVITKDDLTDADREILDALREKPLTKGAIVDKTGLHRNTVGNRLDVLRYGEAIECIHERTALYELKKDPRSNESANMDAQQDFDIEGMKQQINDLETENRELRQELEHLRNLEELDIDKILRGICAAITALDGQDPDISMATGELKTIKEGLE